MAWPPLVSGRLLQDRSRSCPATPARRDRSEMTRPRWSCCPAARGSRPGCCPGRLGRRCGRRRGLDRSADHPRCRTWPRPASRSPSCRPARATGRSLAATSAADGRRRLAASWCGSAPTDGDPASARRAGPRGRWRPRRRRPSSRCCPARTTSRAPAARPGRGDGPAALARRLPVGRRADPRSLVTLPGRGGLRDWSRRSRPATDEHLREELGDLLLQVAFHARIAAGATRRAVVGRRRRRAASSPSWCAGTRTCSPTSDARDGRARRGQLGAAQGGREGPRVSGRRRTDRPARAVPSRRS